MTNLQIITETAIAENIFTEEQVEKFFSEFGMLPLFTFAEWKKKGYFVKKGEKAKMQCFIWRKKKNKANKEATEDNTEETNEREFFKVKAFFFGIEQVEKIAVKVGA